MAEGKNTIVIYTDWGSIFDALENDEAGKLIKHFFDYVRDLNPTAPDKLTLIAFEPIKNQLKRDLKKWESTLEKRSISGKEGGIKSGESRRRKQNEANEASASKSKQNEANEAVIVNDIVIVTDTVFIKIGLTTILMSPSEWLKKNKEISINAIMATELRGVDIDSIYKTIDSQYMGYDFKDPNHVYNTFKSIGKGIKFGDKNTPVIKLKASNPKPFPKQA